MPSASLSVGPIHLFVALGLVAFPPTAHGLTFSPTRRALVRDAVAASGLIAAAGRVAPSHAASVGIAASSPSFESLVQQQQGVAAQLTPEAAQARTRVVDPFAGARDVDPSRSRRFADELAPVSAEERRAAQARAVQDIYSTENKARPKALVSKDAAAPSGAVNNELSDEFTLEFDGGRPLGLKLKDLRVGFETGTREGTSRVLVADVAEGGQAAASKRVAIDNIVVAVDGVNVETASAKDVQARLARAKAEGRAVSVTFKDSFLFNARLSEGDPAAMADARAPIVTKVAPGSATQAEQVLAIRRLEIPERCTRNAAAGDLVEIRYTGRLEDGTVFDGMELAERFSDDSLQFVLGRQPSGQFPPSWDIGLVGMCVGERRLLDVPPVLGFGPKGLPRRRVPPNARLLYDVELIAINALATP